MKSRKKIIGLIITIFFVGLSFGFIKNKEDKTDNLLVFKNEYCNSSSITFQITYENGGFNNGGKPVKCGEELQIEIDPAGPTDFYVSVSGLPQGTKTFTGGYADIQSGSKNVFTLDNEGVIIYSSK